MRLSVPNCPVCGEAASATCDSLLASAHMFRLEDGSFEYTGESTMHWDTQETIGHDDKWQVECAQGHEWPSGINP